MAIIHSLYIFCQVIVLISVTSADPDPRRSPKVYNALITSSQNLEPSKAFPVYQPVLQPHPAVFPFPYQPFYYGDLPLSNGLLPAPALIPNTNTEKAQPPSAAPKDEVADDKTPQPAEISTTIAPETDKTPESDKAPPPPPNTESPIPLNEFGLPPQILPLGHISPSFDIPHFDQFSYPYTGYRYFDPSIQFRFNPYASWPVYPPLTNFVAQYVPHSLNSPAATSPPVTNNDQTSQTPPSEPSDLNVLNYSSKDPAIPNVPPPPLPQGGLKSDKE